MLLARASCRFDTITPALLYLLSIIEEYARVHHLTILILTGTEGHHTVTSRHASGEAVDLWTSDLPDLHPLLQALLHRLGPQFTGTIEQHRRSVYVHLQVKRGVQYTPHPVQHHVGRFTEV